MLEIKNLTVQINQKIIINDLNLKINQGEIHVIMGPNGVGKSTLSAVIMGHPKVEITKGDILFENKSIKEAQVNERAKKGIFLAMQNPSEVEGVSNVQLLKTIINQDLEDPIPLFDLYQKIELEKIKFNMPDDYLRRSVNIGFSGGEKKRNEIIQMKMLNPKLIILDEIDSGLDIDSLKIVCKEINHFFNKEKAILIITHYPKILKYLKPDYVHIMKAGKIKKTGNIKLAYLIEEKGYDHA